DDLSLWLSEQRDVGRQRASSCDHRRQWLGRLMAVRAATAPFRLSEYSAVALDRKGLGPSENGIDSLAQTMEDRVIAVIAERPRAALNRRTTVDSADEVDDHIR